MVIVGERNERRRKTAVGQTAVSVIGLGYVGLPLACLCAEKEFITRCIDTDSTKIELINQGICPIDDKELQEMFKHEKLIATTNFESISSTDIVVICVPTPVDENHEPNFKPLEEACQSVKHYLRKDHLIIIESTVNPGACEEIIKPILEASGLEAGNDFDIAHCPERIDPGNNLWTIKKIPRVVGSTTPEGLQRALSFYRSVLEADVLPMSSIRAAEATKIMENSFRDVNIAFVNEMAKSFSTMGVDVLEVIEAASTKPFSFLPHYPGCGVGGHCIPVDPYFLIRQAKKNGFDHRLLKIAREVNESMPFYTIELLSQELSKLGRTIRNTNIGIMGLAFKPDVADTRESPALKIIKLLEKNRANYYVFDPLLIGQSSVNNLKDFLDLSEALVLVTSHRQFLNMNLEELKTSRVKVIIDGRNCLNKVEIQKLGISYRGMGR